VVVPEGFGRRVSRGAEKGSGPNLPMVREGRKYWKRQVEAEDLKGGLRGRTVNVPFQISRQGLSGRLRTNEGGPGRSTQKAASVGDSQREEPHGEIRAGGRGWNRREAFAVVKQPKEVGKTRRRGVGRDAGEREQGGAADKKNAAYGLRGEGGTWRVKWGQIQQSRGGAGEEGFSTCAESPRTKGSVSKNARTLPGEHSVFWERPKKSKGAVESGVEKSRAEPRRVWTPKRETSPGREASAQQGRSRTGMLRMKRESCWRGEGKQKV